MNFSTYRASLDIHASGSQAVLHAKKGETKRRILITLTERGKPYLISSDCTAVFTATKPDGNIIYNDCAIDNNIICYNFTEQTTAAEGKLDCEIRLYGADNALIISPGFDLIVDAAVYEDGDVIESGTEVSALTALVSETTTLISTVNTKLENGEFNGPAGEAGGWYTPEIKQPIKGAMVVNFTPSKAGMPDVPAKSIILPQGETGETGGYYTPAVTQPDENTLRMSFTPSKESMPAVADTDIPLSAGGSGLTAAQINALDGMFKVCAFIKADISAEYNEFCTAFGIEAATITGISATYSGGNVTAGTSVDELTGIVVTANYSDGSKRTVTGYTLSGTISEGSNTITVTYEGMTTTFTVTGVAEEVTLSSISATYSGGSVPAGTALDDLTGIVVTAQYSDGSTATVTGYTLSGEIAEGSNTITVTYQDKTATFTVTGTAAAQVYTVTNNLTNVTNSNSDTTASGFYSATLTVVDGYSMNSVVITMGGVDITDSIYGDGGILITEVTGDIVITAVAGVALAYALPEPLTFAGTGNTEYDTGYTMYPDGDRTVTWCIELSTNVSQWSGFSMVSSGSAYGLGMNMGNNQRWNVVAHNGQQEVHSIDSDGQMSNKRIVATAKKDVAVYYVWELEADEVVKYDAGGYDYFPGATEKTVKLGSTNTSLIGTVHDFRVYDQILSDGQIEAYLRGGTI